MELTAFRRLIYRLRSNLWVDLIKIISFYSIIYECYEIYADPKPFSFRLWRLRVRLLFHGKSQDGRHGKCDSCIFAMHRIKAEITS